MRTLIYSLIIDAIQSAAHEPVTDMRRFAEGLIAVDETGHASVAA